MTIQNTREILQSLFIFTSLCFTADKEVALMRGHVAWGMVTFFCNSNTRKQDQPRLFFQVCICSLGLSTYLSLKLRPSPPQQTKHHIHPSASPQQQSHDSLNPIREDLPWIPHHPNPIQSSPLPWELNVALTLPSNVFDAWQQCAPTYCISCLGGD